MRWIRPKWFLRRMFPVFFLLILIVLIAAAGFLGYVYTRSVAWSNSLGSHAYQYYPPVALMSLDEAPSKDVVAIRTRPEVLSSSSRFSAQYLLQSLTVVKKNFQKCSFYSCFDVYRCGKLGQDRLSIYIYPIQKYYMEGRLVQSHLSKEFYQIIEAIRLSPYYMPNPDLACVFVPSIDLTNLLALSPGDVKAVLQQLEYWGEDGENHLLINFFPGTFDLTSVSQAAIVAAPNLKEDQFTHEFHIPLVAPNPLLELELRKSQNYKDHSPDVTLGRNVVAITVDAPKVSLDFNILELTSCPGATSIDKLCGPDNQIHSYPNVLRTEFCVVFPKAQHSLLWDVLRMNCIPVIVVERQKLPFENLIDWRRASVMVYHGQLHQLTSILRSISDKKRKSLRAEGEMVFNKYLTNTTAVVDAILKTVQAKVFSHAEKATKQWNDESIQAHIRSPIFNPLAGKTTDGFTAVILAYNRIPSLIKVIQRVATVPSLKKILVIWNNQEMKPPAGISWPKTEKPVKLLQTDANKMSNRFYPFDEIETEAVLALDDDIVMLTSDELEFAFETWKDFPDRIVGFPSRTHSWDNTTQRWKYESEWTNENSMVLTGAAFYHKYWHFAYTYDLNSKIRDWVDEKMNCEDIAMNFLISRMTGKAPIKVAPKKKFKCPDCPVNEMLSTDTGHMGERTECINRFSDIFGYMPLLPAEFRADPVLFKVDGVPSSLKRFSDLGSL